MTEPRVPDHEYALHVCGKLYPEKPPEHVPLHRSLAAMRLEHARAARRELEPDPPRDVTYRLPFRCQDRRDAVPMGMALASRHFPEMGRHPGGGLANFIPVTIEVRDPWGTILACYTAQWEELGTADYQPVTKADP